MLRGKERTKAALSPWRIVGWEVLVRAGAFLAARGVDLLDFLVVRFFVAIPCLVFLIRLARTKESPSRMIIMWANSLEVQRFRRDSPFAPPEIGCSLPMPRAGVSLVRGAFTPDRELVLDVRACA